MEYYLSLITFTFVAGITPGPNNMMLLASGLNHGIRKSMPHYLGICIGFPIMVAVVGFGLGALFEQYPSIYIYIKISGISYLLYLAWKIANAGNSSASSKIRQPLTFIQAATFQWLNPKAWVIAIGALVAFTTPENVTQSVVAIILIYFVMGFICMALWLKLGQGLQQFLRGGKRIHYFNITMAVLLALSVIPMAFSSFGNSV
ncbi:LysE family translocator [SAR92 clade bacterium H455]|uniref:LysE family translocator n=1 Tax=SAR92 clade bacterium H455 TaxID=2974818 RepID=A0ABY5TSI9_9GAMM|nr:LysE family translocator [SAR92 clade bacterium H455]